jgi:hypothetical protein
MGYLDINNLYKDQTILMFRECYALEKIHGSSAHIAFRPESTALNLHAGGIKGAQFASLFDQDFLITKFREMFSDKVTVYGEVYGGKIQKMSETYGKEVRFVVFDVKVGDVWLNVPKAEIVAQSLGLDFVSYIRTSTEIVALDAARDLPSEQAVKNGQGPGRKREGVVLRPLEEFRKNNGERVIAKHKAVEFGETKTPREVSPEQLAILTEAEEIADEWATPMRLQHVLGSLSPEEQIIENMGNIIRLMVEDVLREGAGEIVDSKEARKAIGRKAAKLFSLHLKSILEE